MKKAILFGSLLLCSGYLFCQDTGSRLDSLFKATYKNSEPGAAVIILAAGKPIFKKCYGLANLKTKIPINPFTNFNIGSVTKQFTAYAILQLSAEKKLSLDDRLIKFFPDFNPKIGGTITLQELLTHSSGILDHYAFTDTISVRHATDRAVLEAVKDLDTTYFPPGSEFRYSNTGYCLLAMVIEKVSGLSYVDYVKKYIFHPLSMHQSTVFKMDEPIFQKAIGYDLDSSTRKFRESDAEQSIFFSTQGDGGIYTSVEDYLKWYLALLDGKGVDRTLVQKARSRQYGIDPAEKLYYGYGWFINEQYPETAIYHNGSNGGFQALVFGIPAQNYLVLIFSNRGDVSMDKLLRDINQIFHIRDNSSGKSD
jgi:D-alanyl-D-alanine carboxypeptidase